LEAGTLTIGNRTFTFQDNQLVALNGEALRPIWFPSNPLAQYEGPTGHIEIVVRGEPIHIVADDVAPIAPDENYVSTQGDLGAMQETADQYRQALEDDPDSQIPVDPGTHDVHAE